jgi:hypothetical protein
MGRERNRKRLAAQVLKKIVESRALEKAENESKTRWERTRDWLTRISVVLAIAAAVLGIIASGLQIVESMRSQPPVKIERLEILQVEPNINVIIMPPRCGQ